MTAPGTTSASSTPRDREALITGDAVLLDLRVASFATRIVSAVIDGVLQLGLLVLGTIGIFWVVDQVGQDDGLIAAALLLRGRSPGRLVMGTRVVRDDGGPVHMRQSLLRALMAMLEIWSTSGALALTVAVIDRRSRRLGDLLAGTMVIQERMGDLVPSRVAVPASLQEWAVAADVGRLPLTLMQDIRGFLPRAAQINPESRRQLSRDLLHRTLPHVAPAPPPGTIPEEFLAAVVAERSRRDEERLRREDARQEDLAADVRAVPFRE